MACCAEVSPFRMNILPLMLYDRVNIGGKLLTNYLKELVSFLQWYMMEDTYVINAAKESCCYVAMDFDRDQDICKYVGVF